MTLILIIALLQTPPKLPPITCKVMVIHGQRLKKCQVQAHGKVLTFYAR